MKQKGFFLLALIFGLVAAGSVYMYLNNITYTAPVEMKPLVIANTDIPARTIVKSSDLTTIEVPSQGYPQGGKSSIADVEGSVVLVNLVKGDPVLTPMLESNENSAGADRDSSRGREYAVPIDKRAVAVPINLVSGVGYAVKPGDYVDVLVTMDVKDAAGNASTVTSLAAQDVLVLSAGEKLSSEGDQVEVKSYTLALTVPQAMTVTLGSEEGSIRLLLRNPANSKLRTDPPIDNSVFLSANYFDRYK